MSQIERLWSDQELLNIQDTVVQLRRIRHAATLTLEQPTTFLSKLTHRFALRRVDPAILDHQQALADAEVLGLTAGHFFAKRIGLKTKGSKECASWEETLTDMRERYHSVTPITYAHTTENAVAISTIGHLRNLSIDPEHVLKWDLLTHNNLGIQDLKQLRRRRIGIISPLSGDYLMAATYKGYLAQTKGISLELKPAAMTKDLQHVVLPLDQSGQAIFTELPELAMYFDVVESGNTGRRLAAELAEAYPNHILHQPDFEKAAKIEFQQTQKIKDFWAKQQNRTGKSR